MHYSHFLQICSGVTELQCNLLISHKLPGFKWVSTVNCVLFEPNTVTTGCILGLLVVIQLACRQTLNKLGTCRIYSDWLPEKFWNWFQNGGKDMLFPIDTVRRICFSPEGKYIATPKLMFNSYELWFEIEIGRLRLASFFFLQLILDNERFP